MRKEDLTTRQARELFRVFGPSLGTVRKLHRRMQARNFEKDDELMKAVEKALVAMEGVSSIVFDLCRYK